MCVLSSDCVNIKIDVKGRQVNERILFSEYLMGRFVCFTFVLYSASVKGHVPRRTLQVVKADEKRYLYGSLILNHHKLLA